ncbi:MAG: hypothetical protein A2Z88_02020 [Omnitrophica WOR_2 bacterium GWA2_47_8]|nr:MAG: hypothetical protein A2Z88_02020 [Omnitrophica WOR_2 bacterium GWA2_47_8]
MNIPSIPISLTQKDILILLLCSVVVIALIRVFLLSRSLKKEIERKNVPLLSLKLVAELPNIGLYLENQSDFPGSDILIQNMEVAVESDFRGTLTLKFEPVSNLDPHKFEKLKFKVFNGEFELFHISTDSLMPHLLSLPLEIHLTFSNSDGVSFSSLIKKEKNQNKFIIKEIKEAQ